MFKPHAFRLSNTLLLGLISLLTGAVFFQANVARGDIPRGDCPPDWTVTSFYHCPSGGKIYYTPAQWWVCQTSPSGVCCTYEEYDIWCYDPNTTTTHLGYHYVLYQLGESGKTCTQNQGCI